MKKSNLSIIFPIFGATLLVSPALAQVDQCIAPPELSNPVTCNIPSSGGTCDFGTSDGIVSFPNQTVTGPVTINGGRNVYVGPGHIKLGSGKAAVAFNNPTNVFVEGLHVDANGHCDVFAVRNQLAHQTSFTFQNVYAEGPAYNAMNANNDPNGPLNCHGDLIQNQQIYGGGLNLTVENFVGVTSGQGFFIPRYNPLGNESTTLRNVYIRETNMVDHTYGLLWFWSPQYDPSHQEHRVSLENVNVGWEGWLPILPETGTLTGDVYDFNHTMISGVVNRWQPDGTDLDYSSRTGLNYDRTYFCATAPVPEPVVETQPAPEPDPAPEPSPDLTQADTAAPSVQFASPSNGGSVQWRSKAIITINAIDDVAVSVVELRIRGRRVARFSGPGPHSYEWKVRFRKRDTVTISAQATDMSGNRGEASISVKIAN